MPNRTATRMREDSCRKCVQSGGVLGEIPSRQIVMGAVTQPWVANPVFRPLPPDEFITFNDPNYVKIVCGRCGRSNRAVRIRLSHGNAGCGYRSGGTLQVSALPDFVRFSRGPPD